MPRVKIDYIVSFSSEDPDHPASNLLLREVSKKKWLCRRGESTCSVVLQLHKSVKISGVHIGAFHAALVEVLVGRSETSSEQFQVLVPSSVFISREESRRDAPVARVRSFGKDTFSAPACEQRWDRVRIVCSQPHNKHCQFGLSFVHVDAADEPGAGGAVPPRLLQLDTFSSDEDDFKPGELFAKHQQQASGERPSTASSNTGAQIRQATSQALKNIAESSTKLMKTPISKPGPSRALSPAPDNGRTDSGRADSGRTDSGRADRARDALLYARDDAAPHARIDAVLSRHERDKEHDKPTQKTKQHSKTNDDSNVKNKTKDEPKRTPQRNKNESPPRAQRSHEKPTSAQNKDKEVRKRRRSSSQEQAAPGLAPGPVSSEPHTLLRGAVLVLSGYENPQRAQVRATALALGAQVQRDWGPTATHLICAFPNTPKLRAVRESPGGAAVPAARADWLREQARRRRRLPWQWYATERARRVTPPPALLRDDDVPPDAARPHEPDPDEDTDDEIEKVLQAQKKRRVTESTTNDDSPTASTSGVPVQHDSEDDVATDEEAGGAPAAGGPPLSGALPDFFDGLTFMLDAAPAAARLMARYVTAYGGEVLTMSEVDEGSEVDYVIRGEGARSTSHASLVSHASHVTAAWLARCHQAKALLPHT
ncbi:hypothetical protein PYW08_011455 [Mythimna loreyi]|uniref:Uncharacterized protein n=1 Tax=Mythimna loreyi TaxID=667449 RepID=A0ACC2QJF8_9NEOP|nr:hypothetical protein PYW08_011455 [Mythimna loreyi]